MIYNGTNDCTGASNENLTLEEKVNRGIIERQRVCVESNESISPAPSPANIPFDVCRHQQESKRSKPSKIPVLCKVKLTPLSKNEQECNCNCNNLRSQFGSTPVLSTNKTGRNLKTEFKSTSALEPIYENSSHIPRPRFEKDRCGCLLAAKSAVKSNRRNKSCKTKKKKPKKVQNVFENNSSDLFSRETMTNNQKISSKCTHLRTPFHSAPVVKECLCNKQIKTRCNPLQKLLSSTTIISKKEKTKPASVNSNAKTISLLNRSCLSQKEYMELLSIPNSIQKKTKIPISNKCNKCKIEPCPPRLRQMAVPNKRLVLENWKAYQKVLPTEVCVRFDNILKSTGDDLEPRDARNYFKQLDKRKNKRKKKKKKHLQHCPNICWLNVQVEETTDAILSYFDKEPLYLLNFQQMVMADEILNWLERKNVVKIAKRSTKNVYKKTIVDFCDKLVSWINKLNYSVDLHPLDSKEELYMSKKFSFSSLSEEEVEEEIEEEIEEELTDEAELLLDMVDEEEEDAADEDEEEEEEEEEEEVIEEEEMDEELTEHFTADTEEDEEETNNNKSKVINDGDETTPYTDEDTDDYGDAVDTL